MFKYCVCLPYLNHRRKSDSLSPDSNYTPLADLGIPAFQQVEIVWQVKAPPGLSTSPAGGT